ncbi:MAG: hypothetical protein R2912_00530 [Eubacteriales bacterium]
MEQQLHIALIATHLAPEVTLITHLYAADLAEDLQPLWRASAWSLASRTRYDRRRARGVL